MARMCHGSQEAEAEKITCAKHFEKNMAIQLIMFFI